MHEGYIATDSVRYMCVCVCVCGWVGVLSENALLAESTAATTAAPRADAEDNGHCIELLYERPSSLVIGRVQKLLGRYLMPPSGPPSDAVAPDYGRQRSMGGLHTSS